MSSTATSPAFPAFTGACPECGGTTMLPSGSTLACACCGLVQDDVLVAPVPHVDRLNSQVRASKLGTLVGYGYERARCPALPKLASRSLACYSDQKQTRVHHEIKAICARLGLPDQVAEHADHVAGKCAPRIERGTSMANAAFIAAASTFWAAKSLGIRVGAVELAGDTPMAAGTFRRALLKFSGLVKAHVPALLVASTDEKNTTSPLAYKALEACKAVAGDRFDRLSFGASCKHVLAITGAYLGSLQETSRVSVLAFFTLGIELGRLDKAPSLVAVARETGFSSSSLYNSCTRVLRGCGIGIETSLSKLDFVRAFGCDGPLATGAMARDGDTACGMDVEDDHDNDGDQGSIDDAGDVVAIPCPVPVVAGPAPASVTITATPGVRRRMAGSMATVMLGRPREVGIEPWLRWYGHHHHEAPKTPIKVTRVEEREGPPLLSLGRKPRFRYKPLATGAGLDSLPRHDAGLACG